MNMRIAALLAVGLLAACTNKTSDTEAMAPDAQHAPAAAEPPAAAMDDAAVGKTAMASGVVESVDPDAGKIVIAHGPVETLQWPAMTMGFDATPAQIQAVRPGQRVEFQFNSQGAKNTILHIDPVE